LSAQSLTKFKIVPDGQDGWFCQIIDLSAYRYAGGLMISIDLMLKYSPVPLSVQRKEAEPAEALYQEILSAMRSATPKLLELTCDKQPEKKVAVLSDQISAAILSEKDGAANAGRAAGFFSLAESSVEVKS
jgi:hypothetical protein